MSVTGKGNKIFLTFFTKYVFLSLIFCFFVGFCVCVCLRVCILMIKTCKELVLKITWLTEIGTIYVKYQVLDLAVLLVKA